MTTALPAEVEEKLKVYRALQTGTLRHWNSWRVNIEFMIEL